MNKFLLSILIIVFQFASLEANWKNKTIKDLHRAISWSNTYAIRKIIEHHPEYLNYTDTISYYGTGDAKSPTPEYIRYIVRVSLSNPLIRAIAYRHYASAKQLLKLGADPNVHAITGYTPLIAAIQEHPRRDFLYKDTKYIRLLAEYGANLNDSCHYIPGMVFATSYPLGYTNMLMLCTAHHIDKLKCLVELGADIELCGAPGVTAAVDALLMDIYFAHYLIVEKKADVTRPFYKFRYNGETKEFELDFSEKHYPVEYLFITVYKPESECYKLRKEIVEEFKRQGVDYDSWKKRIPKKTLDTIKYAYGDKWEEYLRNY